MKNDLLMPAGDMTAENKLKNCKQKKSKQGKVKEMLLRQIRYFIVVADAGTFSEAAAQCFISQSALSQQIKSLEDELDVRLLERLPRRVILTEAGRYLYEHGKQLIVAAEKLKTDVQAVANKNSERLTVTWITGSTPQFLDRALCAFKRQFPDVPVDVYSAGYNEAFYALDTGHTDVVLDGRAAPHGSEYDSIYLSDALYSVWISEACPASSKDYVTANDLKDLPCIIVASDRERDAEQQFIREFAGLDNLNLFTQNTDEAALMAAAGSGFYLTDNPNCPAGLKKVSFCKGGLPLAKSYYCYTVNYNKSVQAFADILTDICKGV